MIYPVFLLLITSSLIPLWVEQTICMISIFLIYWDFFCDRTYDLSFRIFHIHLRQICIVLSLGGVLSLYLLDLLGLYCCSSPLLPYWSFAWLFIIESGELKSPSIILEMFLPSVISMFFFIYFGTLFSGMYVLVNVNIVDELTLLSIYNVFLSVTIILLKVYFV